MDNIDRNMGIPPGLLAARALLAAYPPSMQLPHDQFKELYQILIVCGSADACGSCVHAVDCARTYDDLTARLK